MHQGRIMFRQFTDLFFQPAFADCRLPVANFGLMERSGG
jgi:hypothetical protein